MATRTKTTSKRAVKKVAPKRAIKKVVAKTVAKPRVKKEVVVETKIAIGNPVTEVFKTVPDAPTSVEVPSNSVLLLINGSNRGTVDTEGKTLNEFCVQHANRAGIRTFSVYADGRKSDSSDGPKLLTGVAKIELIAKDSRASF